MVWLFRRSKIIAEALAVIVAHIISTNALTIEDTLLLRQTVWPDGALQPDEADALFDLNDACKMRSIAWADFFVDAISHYVVQQLDPKGYVSAENAAWLMARMDKDGLVESFAELDTLVRILEIAKNVPESLQAYVIRQIEQTILTGNGPTRASGEIAAGRIEDAEVALLRRALFARASEGNLIVSRAEADLLFRLKDATLGAENSAGWMQLFVQCVGNHLMAHQDHGALTIEKAAQMEAFVSDRTTSLARFFKRMSATTIGAEVGRYFGAKQTSSGTHHDAAVAISRAVTPEEAAWLRAKISVDDRIDEMEKALLTFVVEEGGSLPAGFADLQKSA